MFYMRAWNKSDFNYMARAIELARSVKGTTFPNPAVGACIVAGGREVGAGATQAAGKPHAERIALGLAGAGARGATLYVSLEPCCHHGRTPPCTDAIIESGIKRVVAASYDPNPLVRGKGFAQLRSAGIRVDTGLLRDHAVSVNEDFFWAITRKQAWITVKLAMTLDGRIADPAGGSRWITGSSARLFGHELRRLHAAVAVGRKTLEHDDPRLTVRHKKGFFPARIVFSSTPALPPDSYFASHAEEARSIIVLPGGVRGVRRGGTTGIEYWHTGERKTGRHLRVFSSMAFENDITSVLVEGGRKLASCFLEQGLVNRLYLLFGNKLLGNGLDGIRFSRGLPVNRSIVLKERRVVMLGDTVGVTGIPVSQK